MRKKQHIWILGCPGVGKLTVANLLSQEIGYPVFDNAKIVDLVALIHPYGTAEFRVFRDILRRSFYEEMLANSKISGLISTNVLKHPDNWTYFEGIENILQSSGWDTTYVLLTATNDELVARVASESRKTKFTIKTKEQMLGWLQENPFCNLVGDHVCHVIDTTVLDAKSTKNKIQSFLLEA